MEVHRMKNPEIRLDILIKKEADYYLAHCLQFDIVATDDIKVAVQKAILDLCVAHIRFSHENNNMDYLFSPAPTEAWTEYYASLSNKKCTFDQKKLQIHLEQTPAEPLIPAFMVQESICNDQPAW
jgi:hypothetical protein